MNAQTKKSQTSLSSGQNGLGTYTYGDLISWTLIYGSRSCFYRGATIAEIDELYQRECVEKELNNGEPATWLTGAQAEAVRNEYERGEKGWKEREMREAAAEKKRDSELDWDLIPDAKFNPHPLPFKPLGKSHSLAD